MYDFDNNFLTEEGCDDDSGSGEEAPELGMGNVGGVFLVLAVGCAFAFFIGILEFLWNVRRVAVEEIVSYCTYYFVNTWISILFDFL